MNACPKRALFSAASLALALLAPRMALAGAAPTQYTFQPLAQVGGMAGDVPIPQGRIWILGPLTDDGQLLIDADTHENNKPDILLQYTDGKFTPLVSAGMEGPIGPWPKGEEVDWPISMNGRGDSVFQIGTETGALVGNFYRDGESGQITAVGLPGTPATPDLTWVGPAAAPAINNRDEIALPGQVKGTGGAPGFGLFFRTPDGALQPIFVPGQALPDGKRVTLSSTFLPSISDAGAVAFLVMPFGNPNFSAYQWEKGSLTPLVTGGMDAPEGGKITGVSSVHLNNQNPSALISARHGSEPGSRLYRLAGGILTPLVVTGQDMPGGGKFSGIAGTDFDPAITFAVSAATEAGQHAFIATLQDGATAVYRLEADGTLALVVKSGTVTPLGKVTHFGLYSLPAMNSKGQIALSVSFDNGPDTLVLLTPAGQ